MSMQDTTADMLTRIRNGLAAKHQSVITSFSKYNFAIAQFLLEQGYLHSVQVIDTKNMRIDLKYYKGEPVIEMLRRISKPSKRVYAKSTELPNVYNGFGVAIISTSQGLLSDKKARQVGVGGEVICYVA